MKITIGKFDSTTGTVPVTFVHEGVTHQRPVNACLTDKGAYDKTATAARVDDVARGVEHKIALGLFAEQPVTDAASVTEGAPSAEIDQAQDPLI